MNGHGGARRGAGRKRKSDELELSNILNQAFPAEDRERVFEVLSARSRAGDTKAASLILAYTYGKPIERQVVTGEDGEAIRVIVQYADVDPAEAPSGAEDDNP